MTTPEQHYYIVRIISPAAQVVNCVEFIAPTKPEAAEGACRMLGLSNEPNGYAFEVREITYVEGIEGQYRRFGVRHVLDAHEEPMLEVVG